MYVPVISASETGAPFGKLISFDRNFPEMEKNFERELILSIDNFWSEKNQKKLKLQSDTINLLYSWKTRSVEWKNFFNKIKK